MTLADKTARVVILFPGYGSHFGIGGRDVYDSSRVVQEYFEEAATCVQAPVLKWAFAASEVELSDPLSGYVTSAMLGVMYATVLAERGIKPAACIGVGMGLLPALHTARVVTLPDMLYAARKIAQFYEEYLDQNNIAMVAISPNGVLPGEAPGVTVGGSLPDGSVRMVGTRTAIETLCEQVTAHGGSWRELPNEVGLFAPGMGDPVSQKFAVYLEKVDLHAPELPVIRFDTGELVATDGARAYLANCMALPLQWSSMLDALATHADMVVVVGNAPELASELQQKLKIPVELVTNMADIERVVQVCSLQPGVKE